MYIYICLHISLRAKPSPASANRAGRPSPERKRRPSRSLARARTNVGRGGDTIGSPHRAQISQFELFELILLLKFDKWFPVEQFEASRAIRGSSISVSRALPPS